MANDFWQRCADAGCVIAVVRVYSQYKNGNIGEEFFLGLRYTAFDFDNTAIGPEYWFMIDQNGGGIDSLFKTPEEALKDFEKKWEG